MTAAERQRMRNIAAADYFRRMKEEHARKEVEQQEARARQVEHALLLAREQVSRGGLFAETEVKCTWLVAKASVSNCWTFITSESFLSSSPVCYVVICVL